MDLAIGGHAECGELRVGRRLYVSVRSASTALESAASTSPNTVTASSADMEAMAAVMPPASAAATKAGMES
jgi:hypothetical protein